jgi:hypothetical protein
MLSTQVALLSRTTSSTPQVLATLPRMSLILSYIDSNTELIPEIEVEDTTASTSSSSSSRSASNTFLEAFKAKDSMLAKVEYNKFKVYLFLLFSAKFRGD